MVVVCLNNQERLCLDDSMMDMAEKAALEAARAAGMEPRGVINVAFVDDETIQGLNSRYLGHDYPTDVLAFPAGEDIPRGGVASLPEIGDVAISIETASRQAKEYGHSLEEEVALLVVHGVLHLLGHDDTPGREAEMRQKEAQALRALGFQGTGE